MNEQKIIELGEKQKFRSVMLHVRSRKPEVRAACATALGKISKDESFNQLTIMLRDSDLSVKTAAVNALSNMCRRNASEYIRYQMDSVKDPSFEAVCKAALVNIANKANT